MKDNDKITLTVGQLKKKLMNEAIEDYNDDDVDFNADFNGGYSSVSQQKKAAADIIQADELKTKNAEFISKFVPKIKNGLNEILSSVETQFEPGKMPKVFGYALRAISKALDNAASEQLIVPIKILTAAIDKAVSDADIIFKKNNTNPVNDKKKSFGDWLGDKLVGNSSINSWFNGPMSVRLNPKTKNIEYVQIRFSSPITLSRDYKDGFWYSSYQLKHGIGDKQMQEFTEMVSDAFPGNAKVESYYNFHNGLFFNFFIGKSGPAKFKRANWYFESNELNNSDKITMTFGQLKRLIKESTSDDVDKDYYKLKNKIPEYIYWANTSHSRNDGWVLTAIEYAQKHNLFYALGTHEDWPDKKSFIYANRRLSKVETYVQEIKNESPYVKIEIFDSTGKIVKTIEPDVYDNSEDDIDPIDYEEPELPEPVAEPNEYFYGNGKNRYDDI